MKKIISFIIVSALMLTLVACGTKESGNTETGTSTTTNAAITTTTVATTTQSTPEYAAMLLMTINPAFRLFLNRDGIVINIEHGNEDAQALLHRIAFEGKTYEQVIETIITVAHGEGYLKTDSEITFYLYEVRGVNADEILAKAQSTADAVTADLEIEVEISGDSNNVSDPVDDIEPTTTTAPVSTTEQSALNPHNLLRENVEYIGNFRETADGLRASALQFDGEVCVLTERFFTSAKPDDDAPSFTYNGREYYSEGGGQTPYYYHLTDSQIIVTHSVWDEPSDAATLTLSFVADDTIRVIESSNALFPVGTTLTII